MREERATSSAPREESGGAGSAGGDGGVRGRRPAETKITVLLQDLTGADGDDVRASVARTLREAVETEVRDYLGTSQAAAVDLHTLRGEPYRAKVQRTYNGLRVVFGKVWDVQTSRFAAKALGQLAELGGVLTNRCVEAELARALERLRDTQGEGEQASASRAVACMVLHELADSVPALVYARRAELASEAIRVFDTIVEQILAWLHDPTASSAQIHGGLRAMGELLRNSFAKDYLAIASNQLCKVTLGFRAHPDLLIKKAVASQIPLLASSNPEAFALAESGYLSVSFHFLSDCIVNGVCESDAFLSLGSTAVAVGSRFSDFVIESLDLAHNSITGLPFPSLSQRIQERLLDAAAKDLLSNMSKHGSGSGGNNVFRMSRSLSESVGTKAKVHTALTAVGEYDFRSLDSMTLCSFVRDCVLDYLDSNWSREEAPKRLSSEVYSLLVRVLPIAVADPDADIRLTALQGFGNDGFDGYLAQPECLRKLLLCLHDEKLQVKEATVSLVGHLSSRNPAHSLPALRKFLMDLMVLLRCEGDALRLQQSHAAKLLSLLIRDAPRLVRPYGSLRFEVDPSVRLEVEILLGKLGAVNPTEIDNYADSAASGKPLRISDHHDVDDVHAVYIGGSSTREAGGWGTGARIAASVPAFDKDTLLVGLGGQQTTLSGAVNDEDAALIGVGNGANANDPKSTLSVEAITSSTERKNEPLWAREELRTVSLVSRLSHPFTAHAEYFPSAALDALHRMLADRRLAHYHREVVGAIVSTVHTLGPKCVSFLPAILPRLMWLLRPGEDNGTRDADFKEYVFKRLGEIVEVARQHTRPYVGDMLLLIREYWDAGPQLLRPVLELTEKLCVALGDEFQPMIPRLLPAMLAVLVSDRARKREPTVQVLSAFETFGSELDDYVTLILPAVLRVAEDRAVPNSVRKESLLSLHPLSRLAGQAEVKELFVQAINSIMAVAVQIRKEFSLFAPTVAKAIKSSTLKDSCEKEVAEVMAILLASGVSERSLPHVSNPEHVRDRAAEWRTRFENTDCGTANKAGSINPSQQASAGKNRTMPANQRRIHVNQRSLRKAWEVGRRHTREDWEEWIQTLGSALFRESGSPALRSCARLAEVYQPLARELFNAVFLSCWAELSSATQAGLVGAVETALLSGSLPLDALQSLLSLAEFMEHDEKPLPIDVRRLAAMACRCGAYAKALHYKEAEYLQDVAGAITGEDGLISIYDHLGQQESAVGALVDAERKIGVRRREEWYEKLGRWDDALKAYEQMQELEEEGGLLAMPSMHTGTRGAESNAGVNPLASPGGGDASQAALSSINSRVDSISLKDAPPVESGSSFGLVVDSDSLPAVSAGGAGSSDINVHRRGSNGVSSAGAAYTFMQHGRAKNWARVVGQIRCMHELGEWHRMESFVRKAWDESEGLGDIRTALSVSGAAANALNLGDWTAFAERLRFVPSDSFHGAFFQTVLAVRQNSFGEARQLVGKARAILDTGLTARVAEGYPRAYSEVLNAQLLTEMEEAITYLEQAALYGESARDKQRIAQTWHSRLSGCRRDHDTWYRTLMVRSMVLHPTENVTEYLEFASLCRKANRFPMASEAIRLVLPAASVQDAVEDCLYRARLTDSMPGSVPLSVQQLISEGSTTVGQDYMSNVTTRMSSLSSRGLADVARLDNWNPDIALRNADPRVAFSYLNYLWSCGRQVEAYESMRARAGGNRLYEDMNAFQGVVVGTGTEGLGSSQGSSTSGAGSSTARMLYARYHLKLSNWSRHFLEHPDDDRPIGLSEQDVHDHAYQATLLDPSWYKALHTWSMLNVEAAQRIEQQDTKALAASRSSRGAVRVVSAKVKSHVIAATNGFFSAMRLGAAMQRTRLQDILRVLTLWFRYGGIKDVNAALTNGFASTEPDMWLEVVPQMIARLHAPLPSVQEGLKNLLIRIGSAHPQALIYPLTVASKSTNRIRRDSACDILDALRVHSAVLVEQVEMVSQELIRVAILWHEMWHENLEEASRLYFGEGNVEGMFEVLAPLHAMMEKGPATVRETNFHREFGRDLAEAAEWCRRYRASNREADLNQAWDLYYHVFRRINKQLPQLNSLELSQVSPKLVQASNLAIAVPGTYQPPSPFQENKLVTIARFAPTLTVISSKQRPRRLVMYGSDGLEYAFLLKGHEDLRQDERVMQFFGLVNELLSQSSDLSKSHLSITRFAAVPLSPNVGLIGWVPNCDTLHVLIRDFREQRKILLNVEHRLMLQMAPDYDNLPLLQKVEVFEYALANTTGTDIARVLWLKSRSAEIWLDRRTNYIRSLATMSMVGYILGLGDRHPSNLMLERVTGKILHIDFGDCWEVAMHREKYPERVPFRLTRMLVNALEICGVEGYFRHTCEEVMGLLRREKASLMAMLEAFIHDPLINWRLLGAGNDAVAPGSGGTNQPAPAGGGAGGGVAGGNPRTTEQQQQQPADREKVGMRQSNRTLGASVHTTAVDMYRPMLQDSQELSRSLVRGTSIRDSQRWLLAEGNLTELAEQHAEAEGQEASNALRADGQEQVALVMGKSVAQTLRSRLQRSVNQEGEIDFTEAVNRRAVAAIQRVSNKLSGRDFDFNEVLGVPEQVQRLIEQATDVENLCVLYVGWSCERLDRDAGTEFHPTVKGAQTSQRRTVCCSVETRFMYKNSVEKRKRSSRLKPAWRTRVRDIMPRELV
ncbi:Target of rapamycin [Porphyridium purpureum]|uniref:non-specific serine/threonine protein kinase n=1 Tax=Porphyridium purpureum TaxID=35688 RepID=A0A5J4YK73_PORPP|nr:Target of rapamycin [Porphyridium purpureum]|eukprot:POR5168..scf261_15